MTVLEKEAAVGRHQSSHNSGVLHAGLYYKPGSRKARLAVRGIRQMVEFCRSRSIAHDVCGKVVVAVTQDEVPRLQALLERGTANGLEGLRWLTPEQLHEIEPHAAGVAAVHVPQEGIADYPARVPGVIRRDSGARRRSDHRRRGERHRREGSVWRVHSSAGDYQAERIVTCAGLQADRVAALTGQARTIHIVPFRGEYYGIRPERQYLVRNLIYPVPDPAFPFLGVHYTRMIHGGIEAGPNAVLAFSREGYRKSDLRVRDLADALAFSGLWKFLTKYPSMCWMEVRRSFSKELFCATLQRLVPEIQPADLVAGGAGVRAQAMTPEERWSRTFISSKGLANCTSSMRRARRQRHHSLLAKRSRKHSRAKARPRRSGFASVPPAYPSMTS